MTTGIDGVKAGAVGRGAVGRGAVGRAALLAEIALLVRSEREARWLVESVGIVGPLGGDGQLAADAVSTVRGLAARRAAGEPLQYVLGRWPFRSLELTVDSRVLIPRPETEQVVEVALAEWARNSAAAPHRAICVDLGTGSGAIALSLAVEGAGITDDVEVWATDASAVALDVAAVNVERLARTRPEAAARVHLRRGDWFGALPASLAGRVDLVVSNPPYVAEEELPGLDPVVRDWEPESALVAARGASGVGGMAAIETIVAGSSRWLRRGGILVVEIAPLQAYAALDVARRAGFSRVTTERDLAGHLRMLVAVR